MSSVATMVSHTHHYSDWIGVDIGGQDKTVMNSLVKKTPIKAVWKFDLSESKAITAPVGARALSVADQSGHICVWMEVDIRETRTERRYFDIVGTGWDIPQDVSREFIGTVPQSGGSLFVWHVYERFE